MAVKPSPEVLVASPLVACAHGGSCGKAGGPVPAAALRQRWQDDDLWRACHLSFSDGLGPSHLANVALFPSRGEAHWVHKPTAKDYLSLPDWAGACKRGQDLLPLPRDVTGKALERFFPPSEISFEKPLSRTAGQVKPSRGDQP